MTKYNFYLAVFFLFLSSPLFAQTYQFINGNWFLDSLFRPMVWYSENGNLQSVAPNKIDSVIDLQGGFIIPPFGEAHNHNVRKFSGFKRLSDQYLKAGIFYVKNPNCLSQTKNDLIKNNLINQKNSIDAVFANGGFTGKGGHPVGVVQIMMMRGEWSKAEGEGNFYNTVSSMKELEKKWPGVIQYKPDFIKVFLFFSEEFNKRENDNKYEGFKGLNPALLKSIVHKAHESGLLVVAHIETATDFHVAIMAGVDEISHMPGFRGDPVLNHRAAAGDYDRFLISDEDARKAAERGVSIVTTLSDVEELPSFISMKSRIKNIAEKNLVKLKNANVKIVLGSDSFDHNSLYEVDYLLKTGIFSNLELLKMLCETTPQSIFTGRKIGKIADGFECSFIVLENDPIKNLQAIRKIKMGVKQGYFLEGIY